jgi:hypothetical protein
MRGLFSTVAFATAIALTACAGRAPNPVAAVNASDSLMTCYQINAEIAANNQKIQDLAREHGWKVAQNVAAGVAGLVVPVLWFGMDWQGSANIEARALQERQQYLAGLSAQKRCANPVRPG